MAGPHPWLEWNDERGAVRRLPLNRPVRAGRDPANDILLPHPTASRQHATITRTATGVAVDASTAPAGMLFQGKKLRGTLVPPGGEFVLAGTTIRVVLAASLPIPRRSTSSPARIVAALAAIGAACLLAVFVLVLVVVTRGGSGDQSVALEIDAEDGGIASTRAGVEVSIPAGALSGDTTVRIAGSDDAPPLQPGFESAGDAVEVDLGGSILSAPATISMPYRPEFAGRVSLATFDEDAGEWVVVPSVEDTNRHVVSAEVMHFSWYKPTVPPGFEFRLPYDEDDRAVNYVGGPHGPDGNLAYVSVDLTTGRGIDFGGAFEVLAVADGTYIGWGDEGDPERPAPDKPKPIAAGYYILIEHRDGIQVMYWHLDRDHTPALVANLEPGDEIAQGFPLGWSGKSGNQASPHLHLELAVGFSPEVKGGDRSKLDPFYRVEADELTLANPYRMNPGISWGMGRSKTLNWDATLDGWSFWMHRVTGSTTKGYKYQGSATRGQTRTQAVTLERKEPLDDIESDAIVADKFDKTVALELNRRDGKRVNKDTAFAYESGTQQTHLESTNVNWCDANSADAKCPKGSGNPPAKGPTSPPEPAVMRNVGGVWHTLPSNPSPAKFEVRVRAYPDAGGPAIAWVNFTINVLGNWPIVCQETRPLERDVYACAFDLDKLGVKQGEAFTLSFDVYASESVHNPAPNGLKQFQRGADAPVPTPKPPATAIPTKPAATPVATKPAATVVPTKPTSRTEVIEFVPIRTEAAEGGVIECFNSSLAVQRPNVWRCIAGSLIKDPCFTIPSNTTHVVCDVTPTRAYGTRHVLKSPLPKANIGTFNPIHAWFVQRTDGVWCEFIQGASAVFEGQRVNYSCDDDIQILGDLESGAVWTATGIRQRGVAPGISEKLDLQFREIIQ